MLLSDVRAVQAIRRAANEAGSNMRSDIGLNMRPDITGARQQIIVPAQQRRKYGGIEYCRANPAFLTYYETRRVATFVSLRRPARLSKFSCSNTSHDRVVDGIAWRMGCA
jgi:hypothetical protein